MQKAVEGWMGILLSSMLLLVVSIDVWKPGGGGGGLCQGPVRCPRIARMPDVPKSAQELCPCMQGDNLAHLLGIEE